MTFLLMAWAASLRATCCRRKVGAVLVTQTEAIYSGRNGAPRGMPHCIERDGGCEVAHGHCASSVHAEINAVIKAARSGGRTDGSTIYTTASPCRSCMGAIINAGVTRVVYADPYRTDDPSGAWALEAAKRLGIEMVHFPLTVQAVDVAGSGQADPGGLY